MKEKKHVSLMSEVLIGSVGSMLLVAMFLFFSFMFVMQKVVRQSTVNSLKQSMDKLNEEISGILGEYNNLVVDLANVIPALDGDREQMKTVVKSMGKNLMPETLLYYATYEQIWDGGTLISHTGWEASNDFDMQSRLWHKNAVNNRNKICYTEPFTDVNTGKIIVTISYNVLDENGKLLGVSAADIVLDALSESVKNIQISKGSKVNIINSDGLYITNEDFNSIMKKNYFDSTKITSYSKKSYLDGTSKSFIENQNFYGIHKIDNTNWFIVADGPASDFASEYMLMILYVFIGVAAIIFVMIIVDILVSRMVSKNFRQIVKGCEYIAAGDFSHKYPDFVTTEASLLAKGFNSFIDSIASLVGTIRDSSDSIQEISNKLADNSKGINDSVYTTENAINGMNSTINKQSTAINSVNQAVEQVAQKVEVLNSEINNQNQLIISSSANIEDMMKNFMEITRSTESMSSKVGSIVEASETNTNALKKSVEQIQEVQAESGALLEMNKVISSVASQTNLLAMNAAIEAAHAGESGKGFAVVADEIRKLAETTSKQAKDSSESLRSIQDKIDEISTSSLAVEKSFEATINEIQNFETTMKGLSSTVSEQGTKAEQIMASLDDIKTSSGNVKESATVITSGTSQVAENCRSLSSMQSEVDTELQKCGTSAENLTSTSKSMTGISEQAQKSVGVLTEAVSKFKV